MSPPHRFLRPLGGFLLGWLLLGALTLPSMATLSKGQENSETPAAPFGEPPPVPTGALDPETLRAIDTAFGANLAEGFWGPEQAAAVAKIGATKDPRLAWILSDFMRVSTAFEERAPLAEAATKLLGLELALGNPWSKTVDHLTAWDVPAPPGYLPVKRRILTTIVPEWDALLRDGPQGEDESHAAIDWRVITWGGVGIDLRAPSETKAPCNCIPAADAPAVTPADEATWLKDDAIVFGISLHGEARAYPRRIMEVREMVNDTLGGEALGIPYCTLCGSAQAFLTGRGEERGEERIVLRTSGLLSRSNKVMFDLKTRSVFDTFRGIAKNGPLAERKVVLDQVNVVTTTWGEWRSAHPQTTVLAEALALGRDFDLRNTRDAKGPIFPVGAVDPRLEVQDEVLGVIAPGGLAVAFPAEVAKAALLRGEEVAQAGVRLTLSAGGLLAQDAGESPDSPKPPRNLGGHLAFWFAWSQFYPDTLVWTP